MAAPKKPSSSPKKPAKKAPAPKSAAAKQNDPIQDTIEMVRGFQINTLLAIGLGIAFIFFQFFDILQVQWWLNIIFAGAAVYFFWLQSDVTEGTELKVCRWGLLLILALFVLRDITISNKLEDYTHKYGDLEEVFSR